MAIGQVTLQQMLSPPMIHGAFNRVSSAPAAFQQFFRMRPTDVATMDFGLNRTGAYDLFESTLTMADGRAPDIGPARIAPRPVGQAYATCMRFYESIVFPYSKVYGQRGLGTMTIDPRGKQWIARQLLYLAERQINAVEFMISRMFRGTGFSISQENERWRLKEQGAGMYDVTFNVPAANKDQLGGLIAATWSSAGTKIIDQMLSINAFAELQTGAPVRHLWMNSKTYLYLLGNTQLNTVRGTAQIMFDQFGETMIDAASGPGRLSGFTVRFPAMPQFLIHVYDGSSIVASEFDPAPATGRTAGNTTKYIPDDIVIMTPDPDPGGWHGFATCTEMVRTGGPNSPAEEVSGLQAFTWPIDEPPGDELRSLNNYVPLLISPKQLFVAKVANF